MNVFRLVLCLAGLTIYLVVKQFLLSGPMPQPPRPSLPASSSSSAPAAQQRERVPCSPRPQTQPHIEVVKPESNYVAVAP